MAESDPTTTSPAKPRARSPWRTGLRIFLSGVVIGIGLALALVYSLRERLRPDVESRLLAWTTPTRLGGEGVAAFARIALEPATRELALSVAIPPALDSAQAARLHLAAPDGRTLIEQALSADELQRGSLLLLLREAVPLAIGIYRLRFEQVGLNSPHEAVFEIVAAD